MIQVKHRSAGTWWFHVSIQLKEQIMIDDELVKYIDVDVAPGWEDTHEAISVLKIHGVSAYRHVRKLYNLRESNVQHAIVKIWHPIENNLLPSVLHIEKSGLRFLRGELEK